MRQHRKAKLTEGGIGKARERQSKSKNNIGKAQEQYGKHTKSKRITQNKTRQNMGKAPEKQSTSIRKAKETYWKAQETRKKNIATYNNICTNIKQKHQKITGNTREKQSKSRRET